MNSSVIGKIEKARRYAQERDRIHFTAFSVDFHGENDDHKVSFEGEKWSCTCDFFSGYGACAHTMALERVLEGMLPAAAASQLAQRA
jgi:hypothetical protein